MLTARGITARPLSHDEFYTLQAVTQGLDQHTWEAPLLPYYGLLWLWTGGGVLTTDLWLRALSLASVVVIAATAAAMAARVRNQRAGYLAAVLIALSASIQQYGQFARPYAVGAAGAMVATYCLLRAMTSTQGGRWWVGYYVSMLFTVIVMPQALAIVVAHGVYVAFTTEGRAVARRWMLAVAGLLPLLVAGVMLMRAGTYSGMHGWLPAPAWDQLSVALYRIGDATETQIAATAVSGFGLLVLAMTTRRGRLIASGAIATAVAIWVVSVIAISFWLGGSFLPLVPLVVIAGAVSIAVLPTRSLNAVMLVLVVVSLPAYTSIRLPRSGEANMREVVRILDAEGAHDDVIFGHPTDAYGLGQALMRYGMQEFTGTITREPTTEYWSLYGDSACVPIQSWPVGADAELRLCQPRQ